MTGTLEEDGEDNVELMGHLIFFGHHYQWGDKCLLLTQFEFRISKQFLTADPSADVVKNKGDSHVGLFLSVLFLLEFQRTWNFEIT